MSLSFEVNEQFFFINEHAFLGVGVLECGGGNDNVAIANCDFQWALWTLTHWFDDIEHIRLNLHKQFDYVYWYR